MSRVKVLVVDDKENMLKLFAKILAEGYELTTAGDGARAMSLVATEAFDVVVTDIRMPGAGGFEVVLGHRGARLVQTQPSCARTRRQPPRRP